MVGLLIPKKSAIFIGTGDLFTAVYLAWSEQGVKVCVSVCICRHLPCVFVHLESYVTRPQPSEHKILPILFVIALP